MQELTKELLQNITFFIGVIGIIIIIVGTLRGLIEFLQKHGFSKARYVIGKHILLGLDFLVVKDIIETVLLNGSEVHLMDLALLITIVGIRIALTTHMSKGVEEMRTQINESAKRSDRMQNEIDYLEKEENELEQEIHDLKKSDLVSAKKRKSLENKIDEINKLLKK